MPESTLKRLVLTWLLFLAFPSSSNQVVGSNVLQDATLDVNTKEYYSFDNLYTHFFFAHFYLVETQSLLFSLYIIVSQIQSRSLESAFSPTLYQIRPRKKLCTALRGKKCCHLPPGQCLSNGCVSCQKAVCQRHACPVKEVKGSCSALHIRSLQLFLKHEVAIPLWLAS